MQIGIAGTIGIDLKDDTTVAVGRNNVQVDLPNTVAEALACGVPCVAFDISGLSDMIEHRKTGWLAKPFDTVDLAAGIKWVARHEHQDILRNAAREKAVSDYSMATMTARYSALYSELLMRSKK